MFVFLNAKLKIANEGNTTRFIVVFDVLDGYRYNENYVFKNMLTFRFPWRHHDITIDVVELRWLNLFFVKDKYVVTHINDRFRYKKR